MPDTKLSSIRELFLRNKRGLLSYLTRRVGREDASDLLQETFVRALRHGQFEAVADPPAFLQQIAVNLTRDFERRRKTEVSYFQFVDYFVDTPSEDASPEEQIEYNRKSRLLTTAIDALPSRCREVFLLSAFEDVPLGEIARRLGISDRMARKHMSLAMRLCRAALD